MGYDLHVTRKDGWSDLGGDDITLEEWLAYIEADSSMRFDGFAEATTTGGGTLRVESPGLAVWVEYSGHGVNGNMAWFDLRERGGVVVKNPDVEIRGKMYQIAQALGAKVQGDEGEEYGVSGMETTTAGDASSSRPWWRFGR